MDNPVIIGIDLGTTNSEVAFVQDSHPEILQNGEGLILPSCVGLDEQGCILVGTSARNQAVAFPERTVLSVKREMGKEKEIALDGQSYSPQEISAFILKALKEKAEKVLEKSVDHAVITVPAYFTDAQRQATKEAGAIAGLEVVRIINEPTAAALAYEGARDGEEKRTILVYDLGGGTFDVSIVKMEEGVVEVLASTGDNHLGGDDFDNKITAWLAGLLKEKHGLDISDNRALSARLKACAEKAKIELSNAPFTQIEEDHITDKIHLSVELTREFFEGMIREEIEKTMGSVTQALKDAALAPGEIDRILLVGGSTRIPMVSEMLKKKMGLEPSQEIDPDLCVALGAGIQAAREMGVDSSGVLIDITPYTFGTSAAETRLDGINPHCFVPLIKRNTKLPASCTEAFYTMVDRQEEALLQVYQGENKNALDNILINSYRFDLSGTPAGSMLTLKYDLDINGILKLEAEEKNTGKKLNAVIDNVFSCDDPDQLKASQEKISNFFQEEMHDQLSTSDDAESDNDAESDMAAPNPMPQDISDILSLAREKMGIAPEEDKNEIIDLMEDITAAAEAGDFKKARDICEELDDILFYID